MSAFCPGCQTRDKRAPLLSRTGVSGWETGTTGVSQPGQINVFVVVFPPDNVQVSFWIPIEAWKHMHQITLNFIICMVSMRPQIQIAPSSVTPWRPSTTCSLPARAHNIYEEFLDADNPTIPSELGAVGFF